MRMVTCKICGKALDPLEFRGHLQEEHYLSYREYYEALLGGTLGNTCWNCGSDRGLLSPLCPGDFILPCEKCSKGSRKDSVVLLERYLSKVVSGKIFPDIILNPGILTESISHDFFKIKGLLEELYTPDKRTTLSVSYRTGYPREFSERNLPGILVESKEELSYRKYSSEEYLIKTPTGGEYYLRIPEKCKYDLRHHARYSIFNFGSSECLRHVKKLRFSDNTCIKFYPSMIYDKEDYCKTIFALSLSSGGPRVKFSEIPRKDQRIIMYSLFRCKPLLGEIKRIYLEISRYSREIYDPVLLRNHTKLTGDPQQPEFRFSWTHETFPPGQFSINISIL